LLFVELRTDKRSEDEHTVDEHKDEHNLEHDFGEDADEADDHHNGIHWSYGPKDTYGLLNVLPTLQAAPHGVLCYSQQVWYCIIIIIINECHCDASSSRKTAGPLRLSR